MPRYSRPFYRELLPCKSRASPLKVGKADTRELLGGRNLPFFRQAAFPFQRVFFCDCQVQEDLSSLLNVGQTALPASFLFSSACYVTPVRMSTGGSEGTGSPGSRFKVEMQEESPEAHGPASADPEAPPPPPLVGSPPPAYEEKPQSAPRGAPPAIVTESASPPPLSNDDPESPRAIQPRPAIVTGAPSIELPDGKSIYIILLTCIHHANIAAFAYTSIAPKTVVV